MFQLPVRVWTAVRRRLWVVLLTTGLVLVAGGVGGWRYAVHQWGKAQAALQAERAAEARERLNLCLTVWPRSPEVRLVAGRAARLALDLPAAEDHLTRALRLPGADAVAIQIELLFVRVQGGEVEVVAPTLIEIVEDGSPHGPVILETLARAYMHQLRYMPAWTCLTRWIEMEPDAVKAYHWRAWTLERLSNHKAAMLDYLRVLDLDPDHVLARTRVAEMLLEDKQAPEVVPHLERLLRQVPDDPVVQARLGACRLLQGRVEEARVLLEAAVVRLPHDPALVVALSNVDLQEGREAEAERRLRAFLAAEPADTEALFVLASALRLQGKTAEAAEAIKEYERKTKLVERVNDLLSKVVDAPAAGAEEFAEVGRLLLETGRTKLGVYWLRRALERNPAHQSSHQALMQHYERTGDAAQALAHRRLLRQPDRPPSPPASPRP